jgi:hypothetical protein
MHALRAPVFFEDIDSVDLLILKQLDLNALRIILEN